MLFLFFKNHGDKDNLVTNIGVPLEDGRFCNGHTFLELMYDHFKTDMNEDE